MGRIRRRGALWAIAFRLRLWMAACASRSGGRRAPRTQRQIPRHQSRADVAAVSNIRNEDTVGEPIGPLLRARRERPHRGRAAEILLVL